MIEITQKQFLEELIEIAESQPQNVNPQNGFACLYWKEEPEGFEADMCLLGKFLHRHGVDTRSLENEGFASAAYFIIKDEDLLELGQRVQMHADATDGGISEGPRQWSDVADYIKENFKDILSADKE